MDGDMSEEEGEYPQQTLKFPVPVDARHPRPTVINAQDPLPGVEPLLDIVPSWGIVPPFGKTEITLGIGVPWDSKRAESNKTSSRAIHTSVGIFLPSTPAPLTVAVSALALTPVLRCTPAAHIVREALFPGVLRSFDVTISNDSGLGTPFSIEPLGKGDHDNDDMVDDDDMRSVSVFSLARDEDASSDEVGRCSVRTVPSEGYLAPGESIDITVTLSPLSVGRVVSVFRVFYEGPTPTGFAIQSEVVPAIPRVHLPMRPAFDLEPSKPLIIEEPLRIKTRTYLPKWLTFVVQNPSDAQRQLHLSFDNFMVPQSVEVPSVFGLLGSSGAAARQNPNSTYNSALNNAALLGNNTPASGHRSSRPGTTTKSPGKGPAAAAPVGFKSRAGRLYGLEQMYVRGIVSLEQSLLRAGNGLVLLARSDVRESPLDPFKADDPKYIAKVIRKNRNGRGPLLGPLPNRRPKQAPRSIFGLAHVDTMGYGHQSLRPDIGCQLPPRGYALVHVCALGDRAGTFRDNLVIRLDGVEYRVPVHCELGGLPFSATSSFVAPPSLNGVRRSAMSLLSAQGVPSFKLALGQERMTLSALRSGAQPTLPLLRPCSLSLPPSLYSPVLSLLLFSLPLLTLILGHVLSHPVVRGEVVQAVPVSESPSPEDVRKPEEGKGETGTYGTETVNQDGEAGSEAGSEGESPVKHSSTQSHPMVCDTCLKYASEVTRDTLVTLSSKSSTSLSPLAHVKTFYKGCRAATEASRALGYGARETAFGHPCHDNLSQRFSFIEVMFTNLSVSASIWGFIGLGRQVIGIDWADYLCYPCLAVLLVYMLAVSPALHGDTMGDWGYPVPLHPLRLIMGQEPYKGKEHRKERMSLAVLLLVMLALTLCYTSVYLGRLLKKTGIREYLPSVYSVLVTPIINKGGDTAYVPTPWGYLVSLCLAVLGIYMICCLFAPAGNAAPSLRFAYTIGVVICVVTILLIFGYNISVGDKWWPDGVYIFDWSTTSIISHISMYVFWGMLQQTLFLSYNHLRLNQGMPDTKLGRSVVCVGTGFFFGLFHIPCWPLAFITGTFGIFGGIFWANPATRSILVFGIMHGINGTLLDELTQIHMSVGPWYYD
ncbi:hypothetical protein KIPB_001123 [Kipferlia bialata]|uniref:Uncharacterized protein n=1 Tax=Kipferlia bialata TaxID=797122 RepID=A0A9K3CNB8_9EUKA|nr:hypothetical protein KIPB_001123 [Kipferlia bialata]|eukprot:g1123.t1